MPTTYAHYRFGQQVRKNAADQIKRIIDKYPQLYLIGVHGPDILFYYHPLWGNQVSKLGHDIHQKPGRVFFTHMRKVLDRIPAGEREPYLSYAYGMLAHFSMDVTCHYTVFHDQFTKELSHTELETEFDRALLEHDKKPTYRQSLIGHIVASEENANVIQAFYPEVTTEQVQSALNGMITVHNLFLAPNPMKRNLLNLALKLVGKYEGMHGLIMNYEENMACHETTVKLLKLYPEAKKRAGRLFAEYDAFLAHEGELGADFDKDFETDYRRNML